VADEPSITRSVAPQCWRAAVYPGKCGQAFYSEDMYLLAGALFDKHASADLSAPLLQLLTAL
jgi:hypothetical protein